MKELLSVICLALAIVCIILACLEKMIRNNTAEATYWTAFATFLAVAAL
jgi:hypothetical protein